MEWKKYNRVCARISLDAIEQNMDAMHDVIKEDTKMIAVIKADGYGHGSVQIAKLLEKKNYMWGFAVAALEEGIVLRKAGITLPILVLGAIFPDQMEDAINNRISFNVYAKDVAEMISAAAVKIGKKAYVHLKIDTGMSRLGFLPGEAAVEEICEVAKLPMLELEGMFTHFAKADEKDKTYFRLQLERYLYMKKALEEKGVTVQKYHCSNSAGIIDHPEVNMDIVRAGIALYGLYPSEEVQKENVKLVPAMELVAHVTFVKWLEAGIPISYGGTYVTSKKTKVATVPVGYADGYPRQLSNKGFVLIHGKKAPIIGRVCMDQFMVDVTDIEDVAYGDEVVLVGEQNGETIAVETLGDLSGRFNYEFVCDINKRVPREYYYGGKIVEQVDFF